MLFLNSVRVAPGQRSAVAGALVALVGLVAGMGAGPLARAQDAGGEMLTPVVVSATRMPQPLQTAPIGATVITADQIMRSGVSDANEAIRKLGGVAGRTDLSNGREYTLDLRGFGATADQNLVVLVDGIRLSENELLSARLSAIPLDRIERIEIVRGGNSVTWGEGASAGVVNVILKSGRERSWAAVTAAVESFDGREARAGGAWSLGATTLEGSVRHLKTDGWRDNSAYEQNTGSVGLRWADHGWRVKLRAQREDQTSRLPGALSFEQYRRDPRQTVTPDDYAQVGETLYAANLEYRWGGWTAALDVGRKALATSSVYDTSGSSYASDTHRTSRQWSPRLTYEARMGGVETTTTLGASWHRWAFDNENTYGTETGHQRNRAVFWRSDLAFPSRTRVSAGVRHERVVKSASSSSATAYERRDSLRAFDLAVSQTIGAGWDAYARVASSYRLPNIDENRYTPMSQALRPQRNRDKEVGLKWARGDHAATVRWFRQKTVDEIVYVMDLFANTNIDPTGRHGMELEGRWSPTPAWTVAGTWQQVSAYYREGVNQGRKQVLVAPHAATLRLTYRLGDAHVLEAGLQRLSAQRLGDDADNSCSRRIPSSTLVDARYAVTQQAWTVALSGTNLTDKRTYNYAYSCTNGTLYPEPGRAVKLTVSRRF